MQVEEAYDMVPATTLYFAEKYDLGATHLNGSFRKVNLLQAIKFLAKSDARVLEVPELLWVRFLPSNVALLAAWKMIGWLRRRPRLAVTYAIENNALPVLLSPRIKLPKPVVAAAGMIIGGLMKAFIDRIAYGSAGSKTLYESLACVQTISHRLIEELPAALAPAKTSSGKNAVFIGELDDRKGILDLMLAWPIVEKAVPDAVLTVIGTGPHSGQVSEWCKERERSRTYAGFLDHEKVKRSLLFADVLVAPSRRFGRWREQIGLPITEAISHGLTVVTTDETGLAAWLAANGHTVIEEDNVARKLPDSVIAALNNPLPPASVAASLPPIPGRIEADTWLHAQ